MKGKGKGTNPNSKKALEPTKWKKGQAVPGAGRPKGALSLKERMKKFLDIEVNVKMPGGSIQSQSVLDSILLSLMSQAQKGNMMAIKEVLDRNFGKEPEKIEIDHELNGTVEELKDAVKLLQKHERDY